MSKDFDLNDLAQAEKWYHHGLVQDVLFTDSAKYLADRAGAYWLIDEIALTQKYSAVVKVEFSPLEAGGRRR